MAVKGSFRKKFKSLLHKSPFLLRTTRSAFTNLLALRIKTIFEVSTFTHRILGMKITRLNVGSGQRRWAGWICLDEIEDRGVTRIMFNESERFPVDSCSIRLAYSSHFLEHIPDKVVSNVLNEIWRCLSPGGAVIIKIPDFDLFVQAYLETNNSRFENIGVESVLSTWSNHGIDDSVDSRFSMMFCGYMNSEYGSHFTEIPNLENSKAFHGPPRIKPSDLHALVLEFAKSPHRIASELRQIAVDEGEIFRWNHQNAWSKEELEALLIEHSFEVDFGYRPDLRALRKSIRDIGAMADWSLFVQARKPNFSSDKRTPDDLVGPGSADS